MHADLRGFVFSSRQLAGDLLNNGVSAGRVRDRHQLKCAVRENDVPFLLLDLRPLCRRGLSLLAIGVSPDAMEKSATAPARNATVTMLRSVI